MYQVFSPARLAVGLLGGLAAVTLAGCSGQAANGDVHGTVVTQAGKPVTAGLVKFFPESGGPPIGGPIAPDGTYRASGVPAGRCKVAVETLQFKHMAPPPKELAKQIHAPRPVYVAIPAKYEKPETSGLETVVKRGDNTVDLKAD